MIETLKQRITSYAARLRWYNCHLLRYQQNLLFQKNDKKFYSQLLTPVNTHNLQSPDLQEVESFWRGIFGKQSNANLEASWLPTVTRLADKCSVVQKPVIEVECFMYCLKRMRNWTAPGPDGIQGFWIKRFPALHRSLLNYFNHMLRDGSKIPH